MRGGVVAVLFQRLRTHYALEAVGVVVLLLHNHDLLRDVLTARCTPRSKEAVVFSRGQNEVAAYWGCHFAGYKPDEVLVAVHVVTAENAIVGTKGYPAEVAAEARIVVEEVALRLDDVLLVLSGSAYVVWQRCGERVFPRQPGQCS